MAKRSERTPEEQEYRDNLAHDLRNLRKRYGENELAQTLLDNQKYHTKEYINSLGDRRKMNKKDALKMIEDDPIFVSTHLYYFKGLDNEVAQKLIKAGEVRNVSMCLISFEGLDKDTANEILDWTPTYRLPYFLSRINSFNTLDKDFLLKFLKKIPERKYFRSDSEFNDYCNKIYNGIKNNIDKFEGISLDRELASKMMEAGLVKQVIENIQDFEGVDVDNIKIE